MHVIFCECGYFASRSLRWFDHTWIGGARVNAHRIFGRATGLTQGGEVCVIVGGSRVSRVAYNCRLARWQTLTDARPTNQLFSRVTVNDAQLSVCTAPTDRRKQ